jgi:Na+/proline symporter
MVAVTVALGLTVLTLAVFSALGVWYARGRVGSVEDFLSARNTAGPGATTATLIASVMGVWILLSPAEAGAAFGGVAAVAGYAVGEALPMLAYAELGPRIRALVPEGHSLTEYALARYGPAMYALVLGVSVLYMFVFLAAEFTGIAQTLALVAGVPRWQTAALVGGFVLLYTAYGGLRASIFTDAVQTVVVSPLLVVCGVGALVALGGPGPVVDRVAAADPSLLNPGFLTGLRFGLWVSIAIVGAELINQTWWQRIYAARDPATLRRGFRIAAVVNAALVAVAGLFGVVARGYVDLGVGGGGEYRASVAFFVLLVEAFPEWIVLGVVLVALLLVMSSADSLVNALASVVTVDLPRLLSDPDDRTLVFGARALTVVVAVAAVYVSLRARSVLRLFLFADLLGAAVAVPLLAGLYSRRVTGPGVLVAAIAALAVGVVYFPPAIVRGVVAAVPVLGPALPAPSFLWSFVGAAGVSTGLTALAVLAGWAAGVRFEFDDLAAAVRRFDDEEVAADGGCEETD